MHFETKNEVFFAFLSAIVIFLFLIGFIIYFIHLYESRKRQNMLEKQQLQSSFQQELLRAQLEIQEQTFRNISLEIHDNIGQILTLVKLNINTMFETEAKDLQGKIYDTRDLVTKAIQDLRDLSKTLNTDFVTEMGLVKSIEHELALLKKIAGIKTVFSKNGEPYSLSQQKELILFRIFQEVINNIIKHAKASSIEVSVNYETAFFKLNIKDDGQGFNISVLNKGSVQKAGLGIRNMQNRSELIGAAFDIISSKMQGTTINIVLPIA